MPPEGWPLDAKGWRKLNALADKAAKEGAEACGGVGVSTEEGGVGRRSASLVLNQQED